MEREVADEPRCVPACDAVSEEAERAARQKLRFVGADDVQKTVDAVTGATWGTRNRIMAGMFQRDMRLHADEMPSFAPPGVSLE